MAITPALLPTLTSPIAFFVPPTLTLVSELTVYEAVNPSSLFRVIDVGDTAVTCPRWTSITTGLPSWPLSVSSPCSTRFASARRGQPCRCAGLSSDPFGPEVASDPFGSKIASNPLGLVVADQAAVVAHQPSEYSRHHPASSRSGPADGVVEGFQLFGWVVAF